MVDDHISIRKLRESIERNTKEEKLAAMTPEERKEHDFANRIANCALFGCLLILSVSALAIVVAVAVAAVRWALR